MPPEGPLTDIPEFIKAIAEGSGTAVAGLQSLNEAVLSSGNGLEAIKNSLKNAGSTLNSFGSSIESLTSSIPIVNILGEAFGMVGDIFGAVGNVASDVVGAYTNVIKATDELGRINRELFKSNFELAMQFGLSSEEAEKMTSEMLSSADRLSGADFGFQNFAKDTKPMMDAMANQRISFEKMRDTIQTTAGTYRLYDVAVLQAAALGMSAAEYSGNLSSAIQKQGLTVQEASELLSTYGAISERTGLTTKMIADSLNGLGDNFRKLGLNANFGQSFILGFAQTLKEANLGIENATDLTNTFGTALAGLTTDYSMAYVTAMKGGLDLGSGGALGASIQMRARMMEPGTNQAEFGRELAGAIKETISQFGGGGEIVTLKEAAASRDPRLEQIYYTQTQLLSSLYNISRPEDQDRILELLEKIGEVSTIGNEEAMAEIGKDLKQAIGGRDKSLSNEEKLNAIAIAQLAQISTQTSVLTEGFANLIEVSAIDNVANSFRKVVKDFNVADQAQKINELLEQAKNSPEESKDFFKQLASIKTDDNDEDTDGDKGDARISSILLDNLAEIFTTKTIQVKDPGLTSAFSDLAASIRLLSSKIVGEPIPGIVSGGS